MIADFFAKLAIYFDLPILDWIAGNLRCDFLDWFMPIITVLGDAGIFWIACAVILILIPKQRKAGLSMGLALLMGLVIVMGRIFIALDRKAAAKAAAQLAAMPAPTPVEELPQPVAPGAAGGVKLHDVEPKTAAMLMAIVANQMGKPLNELRFISIKEIK